MRVVIVRRILFKGSVYIEGCSEDLMYFFSFLSIRDTLYLVYCWSCDHY